MHKVFKFLISWTSNPELWILGIFIPLMFGAYIAVITAALHLWNPHLYHLSDCRLSGSPCF